MRGCQRSVRTPRKSGRRKLHEKRHGPPDRRRGAVEAGICALAIQQGQMLPNANLQQLDPDCDVNVIRDVARDQRIRMALSNSLIWWQQQLPGLSSS